MGTKVWPIALLVLLLLAFLGYWFSLTARMAKAVIDKRARIVFDMQIPPTAKSNPEAQRELQRKTESVIKKRLSLMFDKTTFEVSRNGDSAIEVEMPKNIKAKDVRELLTAEGRVQQLWAKNLVTDINDKRRYDLRSTDAYSDDIAFYDLFQVEKKEIRYGSPEYDKILKGWVLVLDSEDIQSCEPTEMPRGLAPYISFTSGGAAKLESWCRKYSREKENLAFVVDGKVISIAPLKEGTILTDSAYIDGQFKEEYVRRLCAQIGGGRLPVKLVERKTGK